MVIEVVLIIVLISTPMMLTIGVCDVESVHTDHTLISNNNYDKLTITKVGFDSSSFSDFSLLLFVLEEYC